MHLKTCDEFEQNINHITSLFACSPGTKGYWGFELPFNSHLLLVNARIKVDFGLTMLRRYLFSDVLKALDFLNDEDGVNGIKSYSIFVLTRYQEEECGFKVSEVLEIIEAGVEDNDANITPGYAFIFSDGTRYVADIVGSLPAKGTKVNEKKVIYQLKKNQ